MILILFHNIFLSSLRKSISNFSYILPLALCNLTFTLEILIPIAFFGTILAIIYVTISARNKERLALIEKGADASLFKSKERQGYNVIKIGLLFIGVAVGLLVGNILHKNMVLDPPVAYFSMIFLGGGIGLVSSHFVVSKLRQKDDEKESN